MGDWSDKQKNEIWNKAKYCELNNEKNGFRKDQCGAWIKWDEYGNRNSKYGWEIDHIKLVSKAGKDIVSNARPLHWKNNASRQDGRLVTVVTSEGDKNIIVETGKEFVP